MLPLSRARRPSVALALSAVTLTLATACGKPPTAAECTALLDRYTEKLVASDRPDVTPGELEKLKATARARAAEDPAFAQCSQKVSRSAYDCAMRAETVDRMEICLN
jgi:hypothetical protein